MTNEQSRILVVDDYATNRLRLSTGLKKQGHPVEVAASGRQALEMLRLQSFDLVLLDILMPEMDGYQVLTQMKADSRLRDIPVIVISGKDEMASVVKGIELGAEDYLPKSFDSALLKARIGACLTKKKLRDLEQLYLKGLERELEIGRQIQAGFLPEALPQLPNWEIAARFQAAREVAGDFYDAFILPREQKVGLVIGDVCDKGVGAALFMTLFRSLIRVIANVDHFMHGVSLPFTTLKTDERHLNSLKTLKNTITQTNSYVVSTHGRAAKFATLFFGLLDPDTGSLLYVNGGNEPPLIFNSAGIKTYLEPTGPVVGIWPDAEFQVQEVYLEPDDTLFAYTDGLTDALGSNGQPFTLERLLPLLAQPVSSATTLLNWVETNLQSYTFGANPFDDITMLAVRRAA